MFEQTDQYNEVLTAYAQGAYQNPGTAVDLSRVLFPAVGVEEAQGTYDKWDPATSFTAQDTLLARHNTPHRIEVNKTRGYFNCRPEALEIAHWTPALMQRSGPRYREAGVRALMSAQFTSRQVTAVEAFKAGVKAEEATLGKFSTEGSNVITAIDTLLEKVSKGTYGRRPTHLVMGRSAWNICRNHPSLVERIHGLSYALIEEAFLSTLTFQGIQLVISDNYAIVNGVLTELLGKDIIAVYNEETPSMDDLSAGKEFTLSPAGPEVISYKSHGVYDVDMLMWSSDRQITNPAASARLEIS